MTCRDILIAYLLVAATGPAVAFQCMPLGGKRYSFPSAGNNILSAEGKAVHAIMHACVEDALNVLAFRHNEYPRYFAPLANGTLGTGLLPQSHWRELDDMLARLMETEFAGVLTNNNAEVEMLGLVNLFTVGENNRVWFQDMNHIEGGWGFPTIKASPEPSRGWRALSDAWEDVFGAPLPGNHPLYNADELWGEIFLATTNLTYAWAFRLYPLTWWIVRPAGQSRYQPLLSDIGNFINDRTAAVYYYPQFFSAFHVYRGDSPFAVETRRLNWGHITRWDMHIVTNVDNTATVSFSYLESAGAWTNDTTEISRVRYGTPCEFTASASGRQTDYVVTVPAVWCFGDETTEQVIDGVPCVCRAIKYRVGIELEDQIHGECSYAINLARLKLDLPQQPIPYPPRRYFLRLNQATSPFVYQRTGADYFTFDDVSVSNSVVHQTPHMDITTFEGGVSNAVAQAHIFANDESMWWPDGTRVPRMEFQQDLPDIVIDPLDTDWVSVTRKEDGEWLGFSKKDVWQLTRTPPAPITRKLVVKPPVLDKNGIPLYSENAPWEVRAKVAAHLFGAWRFSSWMLY